jgi:hypothetical protein
VVSVNRVSLSEFLGCHFICSTIHNYSDTFNNTYSNHTNTLGVIGSTGLFPRSFPNVPTDSLPDSITGVLQAILDDAVKDRLPGVSATLLAADGEAWSGEAGYAKPLK